MQNRVSTPTFARLDATIVTLLRARPQTARDLERATTSAHSAIARRLVLLRDAGIIHVRINPFNVTGRPPRVWFIGPGPEAPPDPDDLPKQILTKAAPTGARRDEIVTAFFGVRNMDPCCVYCRAFQFDPHEPDCAVARFV